MEQNAKLFQNVNWITYSGQQVLADQVTTGNPWGISAEDRYEMEFRNENGDLGLPILRKKFRISLENVKKCTVYATSLGIFDMYMNGARVGVRTSAGTVFDELKPGWTDYRKRVLYYTYRLDKYLKNGDNALAVALAPGWYQGRISFGTYGKHKLAFIAKIIIEFSDGSVREIVTDNSWKWFFGGAVANADIWDGEIVDASRQSYSDYSMYDFDDSSWKNAEQFDEFEGVITKKVGPSIRVRKFLNMKPVSQVIYDKIIPDETDFGHVNIVSDKKNSCQCKLKKGETVIYDMGQNMVGWAHIKVRGAKGTNIVIRYGEFLNDTGMLNRGNDGPKDSVYTANYRSAKAKVYYTMSGKETEEYRPTFTFFGFRYIEISANDDIELVSVKADVVGSDNREVGYLETSNSDVNKLISNILWGQRGNYLSVPTDCPQRDERLGWTGDTQVFCPAACFNADVRMFFHKWLQDARDSQFEGGHYTDVIPYVKVVGAGAAAWGDAGIIVPYNIYRVYNDRSIIEECYESMEKYMGFLSTTSLNGPIPTYGDWLAYEPTDNKYISICYYALDARLMAFMSDVIGKTERAEHYRKLYKDIKNHFAEVWLDEDGRLKQVTQTTLLLGLKNDLLPASYRKEAIKLLEKKIIDNGYKLSTGFVGTGVLNQELSELGLSDLAYSLLLQTDNPSWLYSVYQGATTIWERWNSYTIATGFGDVGMNSFNHYAYGVVAEWMYKRMLGIDADDNDPGFRHIILRPTPDTRKGKNLPDGQSNITWVKGAYKSASGLIKAQWKIADGEFVYAVSIPEGTYATLYLPLLNTKSDIVINGIVHKTSEYTKADSCAEIELAAGSYEFTLKL